MQAFFEELWMILVESSVWLIAGFAIAGIVHALIPREWMLKHLSGRGFWPITKASLLGIPLPLCSCSVIPVAAGLRKQGASKGASAAFAISTPQTGEESIPITWALFGPVYAFTRPIVAVITGLVAGLLIDLVSKPDESATEIESDEGAIGLSIVNAQDASQVVEPTDTCCSSKPDAASSSCCSTQASTQGVGDKIRSAFVHGFKTMPIDLVLWLCLGILLAAAIGAFVPESFFTQYAGDGIVPKLAMLVVGVPLYICATSSTPLAWSLVVAGLSPGAALVMLLAGPATNVATMSWIIKDLGAKALGIYLVVIAAVALAAGTIFDLFFAKFVTIATKSELHQHASGFGIKEAFAIAFIVLMAWALGMKARGFLDARGIGRPSPAGGSCCSGKPGQSSSCCSGQ